MYSDAVADHLKNPRNLGEMPGADVKGEVVNPLCGDMLTMYLKVENDIIQDARFLSFGCPAAIAVSSMITEKVKGKSLEEAKKASSQAIAEALEGLPPDKHHCSNLGADAFLLAIRMYENSKAGKNPESGS